LPTPEVPLPRLLDPFTRAAFDLTIGQERASRRCAASRGDPCDQDGG
jgi:hypothetical protein